MLCQVITFVYSISSGLQRRIFCIFIGLTVISCFASVTAISWRSNAFLPALVLLASQVAAAGLFLQSALAVPHEQCCEHFSPSSRQGQPRLFLPLPLLHVFLQLQNFKKNVCKDDLYLNINSCKLIYQITEMHSPAFVRRPGRFAQKEQHARHQLVRPCLERRRLVIRNSLNRLPDRNVTHSNLNQTGSQTLQKSKSKLHKIAENRY